MGVQDDGDTTAPAQTSSEKKDLAVDAAKRAGDAAANAELGSVFDNSAEGLKQGEKAVETKVNEAACSIVHFQCHFTSSSFYIAND